MVLVVPDICRFTVNQELEGNNIANIIDCQVDTTGSSMSREEAIEQLAGVIIDAWGAGPLSYQVNDLSLVSVSWVDLDEADGSTGTRTTTGTYTLPVTGDSVGAPLPANTSVLVKKTLATGGRAHRSGRMFIAGFPEDATATDNGNRLDTAVATGVQTVMDTFLEDLVQTDPLGTQYASEMVVVHVTARDGDGHPTAGDYRAVGDLVVDPLLATQRRRLRR